MQQLLEKFTRKARWRSVRGPYLAAAISAAPILAEFQLFLSISGQPYGLTRAAPKDSCTKDLAQQNAQQT